MRGELERHLLVRSGANPARDGERDRLEIEEHSWPCPALRLLGDGIAVAIRRAAECGGLDPREARARHRLPRALGPHVNPPPRPRPEPPRAGQEWFQTFRSQCSPDTTKKK